MTIRVIKHRRLYIPTVFSPNGDGFNDVFFISGDDRQIVQVKKFLIVNRWGDVMHEATDFHPNDETKGWDGNYKADKLNPGVFVYVAEVEFIDGEVVRYTGDVTLVR